MLWKFYACASAALPDKKNRFFKYPYLHGVWEDHGAYAPVGLVDGVNEEDVEDGDERDGDDLDDEEPNPDKHLVAPRHAERRARRVLAA